MTLTLIGGPVFLAAGRHARFWRGLNEGDPAAWIILFGAIAFIAVPPLYRWLQKRPPGSDTPESRTDE